MTISTLPGHLIEIPGHALIHPDAVKLVHVRRNVTPYRCPDTGALHHAHVAIETYHDVYRLPFRTIDEASAAFAGIVAGVKAHRLALAEAAAARRELTRTNRAIDILAAAPRAGLAEAAE